MVMVVGVGLGGGGGMGLQGRRPGSGGRGTRLVNGGRERWPGE